MDGDEKLSRLHDALVTDWALSEDAGPSMDLLLEALAARVQELLDRDMNRLTTAMYTLDIDEERFNEAMSSPETEMKSMGVAELILERENQKMESHMRYEEIKRREANEKSADPPLEGNRPTIDLD